MKAKVIFEDDGDNVIISTEGALADKGTVAQNAAIAVYEQFTREYRVKKKGHQACEINKGEEKGWINIGDARLEIPHESRSLKLRINIQEKLNNR